MHVPSGTPKPRVGAPHAGNRGYPAWASPQPFSLSLAINQMGQAVRCLQYNFGSRQWAQASQNRTWYFMQTSAPGLSG
jgi:hypothetical protein